MIPVHTGALEIKSSYGGYGLGKLGKLLIDSGIDVAVIAAHSRFALLHPAVFSSGFLEVGVVVLLKAKAFLVEFPHACVVSRRTR